MLRIIPVDIKVRFDDVAPVARLPAWLVSGVMDVEAWTDGLHVHSWSIEGIALETGLDVEVLPDGSIDDMTPTGQPAREITALSHPGLYPLLRTALIGSYTKVVERHVEDMGLPVDRRPLGRRWARPSRQEAFA